MYVLWQKGIRVCCVIVRVSGCRETTPATSISIRGKLWHYIRDFYCSSKRRVQYNRHLSKCFYIDMGVAQGDTLSCILFDFYIDGLVQLVYE